MKKYWSVIVIAALILSLTGCSKEIAYVPIDSVHYVKTTVYDTVISIKLVAYKDSVSIVDTFSRLENKYALSTALWSKNRLNHVLQIKDVSIPVKTQYIEKIVIDSVQVPYKVVVTKEVNKLTKFQKFEIRWFWYIVIGFIVYFAWTKRKWIIKFIKQKGAK